jgi:hypothetical protein
MSEPSSPAPRLSKAVSGGKITLGGRVSARLGHLLPVSPGRLVRADPNAKRQSRKNRASVFDVGVEISGQKKLKVHFNDGQEKEISSNQLKSHHQAASLPPEDARLIIEQGVNGGDNVPASLEHLHALASEAVVE